MAKPYSEDLRARVRTAIGEGGSLRSIAERFDLAPSTVITWAKRIRDTGSIAPAKFGGHKRCRLEAHRSVVLNLIENTPHLTLHRLKALLAARGVAVSHDTVWRFLRREGLSFKKTLLAIEQFRSDVARRRERWRGAMDKLDSERLVFIDETWIKTDMAPIRGWGPKGERLPGYAPDSRWRTYTFIGALRVNALTAPCVIDGPVNGGLFRLYVEHLLVPTLRAGDIVILNNLGSHRGHAVRDAIRSAGATLAFLPSYSPDLNPIEQALSKIKHWMRMAQERTLEAISERVAHVVAAITERECRNYIHNVGYGQT